MTKQLESTKMQLERLRRDKSKADEEVRTLQASLANARSKAAAAASAVSTAPQQTSAPDPDVLQKVRRQHVGVNLIYTH